MTTRSPLRALDRLLSRSVPGTLLVLVGSGLVALGLLYGTAIGLTDLLASRPDSTAASAGGPFAAVGVVLLAGAGIIALGAQLVGYAR